MKIFKILSLAFIIGVVASCDPYEDAYKDFDEANEIVFEQGLEINLTDDDYGTISNLAMRQAQNAQDSAEAAFVGANGYFTDSIAAADLIPWFLNDQYGQYGPGTSAMVSFNYNGDMPVELKNMPNRYNMKLQKPIMKVFLLKSGLLNTSTPNVRQGFMSLIFLMNFITIHDPIRWFW